MPAKGKAYPGGVQRFTAAEKAAKKLELVELRAQGWSWTKVCADAGIASRTFRQWKQQDEKFAVMCDLANGTRKDVLVDESLALARDPKTSDAQRAWLYMFHIKQADPSYRDNHKVEHVVSGGLQSALKQLAKLGAE